MIWALYFSVAAVVLVAEVLAMLKGIQGGAVQLSFDRKSDVLHFAYGQFVTMAGIAVLWPLSLPNIARDVVRALQAAREGGALPSVKYETRRLAQLDPEQFAVQWKQCTDAVNARMVGVGDELKGVSPLVFSQVLMAQATQQTNSELRRQGFDDIGSVERYLVSVVRQQVRIVFDEPEES